jgi:hypothetical protein
MSVIALFIASAPFLTRTGPFLSKANRFRPVDFRRIGRFCIVQPRIKALVTIAVQYCLHRRPRRLACVGPGLSDKPTGASSIPACSFFGIGPFQGSLAPFEMIGGPFCARSFSINFCSPTDRAGRTEEPCRTPVDLSRPRGHAIRSWKVRGVVETSSPPPRDCGSSLDVAVAYRMQFEASKRSGVGRACCISSTRVKTVQRALQARPHPSGRRLSRDQDNSHAALTRTPHWQTGRAGLFSVAPPAKRLRVTAQAAEGYARAPAHEAATSPTGGA